MKPARQHQAMSRCGQVPSHIRWAGHWLAALVMAGAPLAAQADIWGYVDARGFAHFASERLDDRYELFLRGAERPDASAAGAAEDAVEATPRPVAVPTAPPKLLAFFEVSTNYKSVKHLLREASQQFNLDYELLQAVIATESGFDPQAISPRGAIGLMQVIPDTAARYGVTGDRAVPIERKLSDPATNIRTGSRYLRYLVNLFGGQLELALAAYNAGEGAVQRAGNRIPAYPETQNYVRTVLQLYQVLKPPAPVAEQRRANTPARPRADSGPKAVIGGAFGRSNMVPALNSVPSALPPAAVVAAPAAPEFKIERD